MARGRAAGKRNLAQTQQEALGPYRQLKVRRIYWAVTELGNLKLDVDAGTAQVDDIEAATADVIEDNAAEPSTESKASTDSTPPPPPAVPAQWATTLTAGTSSGTGTALDGLSTSTTVASRPPTPSSSEP